MQCIPSPCNRFVFPLQSFVYTVTILRSSFVQFKSINVLLYSIWAWKVEFIFMAIQLLVKPICFIFFWQPVLPNGKKPLSSLTWMADSAYLASSNYLSVVSPQRPLSIDVSRISISSAQLPQINLLLPSPICLNIMQNIFQTLRWE